MIFSCLGVQILAFRLWIFSIKAEVGSMDLSFEDKYVFFMVSDFIDFSWVYFMRVIMMFFLVLRIF